MSDKHMFNIGNLWRVMALGMSKHSTISFADCIKYAGWADDLARSADWYKWKGKAYE